MKEKEEEMSGHMEEDIDIGTEEQRDAKMEEEME